MKRFAPVLLAIALSGCSFLSSQGNSQESSSSSESSVQETRNVSYTGQLEKLGASMYLQGTHQLLLEDGKTVILESALLTLDDYAGMQVVVFGAVRPTEETGGIIMRVEAVTILSSSSSSSSEESSSSSELSSSSSSFSSSRSSTPASKSSIAAVSSKASVAASSVAAGVSADVDAQVKAMAKDDMSAAKWSQQYCTSHIGFCVPIQKNWWFTSFGTTGSSLWHVEVSNKEIAGLGDGPIVINLMTGSLESTGKTDNSVSENGGFVVAYRAWKDNTHFEISAPAALKSAVTFMAQSLTSYQVSQ